MGRVLLGCLWTTATAAAAAPFSRDFNGPDTHWQLLESGIAARIVAHECQTGGARDDAGCEHVALAATAGESALLAIATEPMAVLDELEVRLWVKANRPGVRIAARISLPRSVNQRSHEPATAVVRGEAYTRPGHWQQLQLDHVPKLLADEVRVLRTVPGAALDPREAFLDAVVLMVPGGPDVTQVWTDDLLVDGVIVDRARGVQLAAFNVAGSQSRPAAIRLQAGTLTVDDRPFLPRAIQWRGEPLQLLAELGFNVVYLPALPTEAQAADARRLGLWLLCSPPRPDELGPDALRSHLDRVLAWCLPDDVGDADPAYLRRWAELMRQHDPVPGRPIVALPETDHGFANESIDVFVARHPLAGRLNDEDFARWLADRRRVAKPGAPLWLAIPTQYGQDVAAQCRALVGEPLPPPGVDGHQLQMMVRAATTQGIRGLVFLSEESLAGNDAATRRRAARLESLNERLQVVEPWLAGGTVVARVASSDPAWAAMLLNVDYARLLVPLSTAADVVPRTPPSGNSGAGATFVVPGVPESCQAYRLSPAELQPLTTQRVTGGMRVAFEPGEHTLVLLTEDPRVLAGVRERIARHGVQAARLERDLAASEAAAVIDTARQLAPLGFACDEAMRAATAAHTRLRQVDGLLAAGRPADALRLAGTVRQSLHGATRLLRQAVDAKAGLQITPFSLSDEQLLDQARWIRRDGALRGGDNRLPAGDFEDVGQMTSAGWQHVCYPDGPVTPQVKLSAVGPRHGQYCLEIEANDAAPGEVPAADLAAPVWIVSPSVPVAKGEIIEITGWVRAANNSPVSTSGLEIVDSLGGPELALVIGGTTGWEPFRMIRAASESTELRITFALSGRGTVQLDGVMVRPLQAPIARRLPPAGVK